MTKQLNDKIIAGLEAGLYFYAGVKAQGNTAPAGFGVKVNPAGSRSFVLRYAVAGKDRLQVIGQYPTWSVTAAIKEARQLRQQVDRGDDPLGARRQQEQAAADTLKAICAEYLKRAGERLRTHDAQKRILERLVYPELGDRQIGAIKRSDVIRLMDKIEDENGVVMADKTLSIVRRVMNWHETRGDDFSSPIRRGMRRISTKERARDRILTDDELRAVWQAAEASATAFGRLVRFILLTSARRSEAAEMPWSEIRDSVWTLPPERNKTKEALPRPLTPQALSVLGPRLNGGVSRECEFVFDSSRGSGAVAAFSKMLPAFHAASGTADWTLHDLRRTARSLMSRAGVSSDHAERCLGHVIGGVRAVYDRYEYLDDKRKAFEALAGLIERIVDPAANVVALRA